jgi:hypothetical protein
MEIKRVHSTSRVTGSKLSVATIVLLSAIGEGGEAPGEDCAAG